MGCPPVVADSEDNVVHLEDGPSIDPPLMFADPVLPASDLKDGLWELKSPSMLRDPLMVNMFTKETINSVGTPVSAMVGDSGELDLFEGSVDLNTGVMRGYVPGQALTEYAGGKSDGGREPSCSGSLYVYDQMLTGSSEVQSDYKREPPDPIHLDSSRIAEISSNILSDAAVVRVGDLVVPCGPELSVGCFSKHPSDTTSLRFSQVGGGDKVRELVDVPSSVGEDNGNEVSSCPPGQLGIALESSCVPTLLGGTDTEICPGDVGSYSGFRGFSNSRVGDTDVRTDVAICLLQPPSGVRVTVNAKIMNESLTVIVDCGAEISTIRRSIAKRLGLPLQSGLKVAVKMAGGAVFDDADVTEVITLEMGVHQYTHTLLVADIEDDLLLGSDFFSKYECAIDFQDREVKTSVGIIPMQIAVHSDGALQAPRQLRIPANSGKFFWIKFNSPEKVEVVLEGASTLPEGVHLVDSVTMARPALSVCIMNVNPHSVTLQRGTVLGYVSTIEDMWSQDELVDGLLKQPLVPKITPTLRKLASTEIPSHLIKLYDDSSKSLGAEEQQQLRHLLIDYQDVFAQDDFNLGNFTEILHKIDTGDSRPIRQRMRRTPLGFENEEEKHLQSMLSHGVIQPSQSDWASAPVLIRKQDGTVRYCIDYRALNSATVKDAFPLPRIEECIDMLHGTEYFCTLDLASGYWQLSVDPSDRHKTAFITRYGLFEHVRMGFGLCNAPATFQRAMNLVLQGLLWKKVICYLDDVITLGTSIADSFCSLTTVLDRMRQYNLKLKPRKCKLFLRSVEFLGRVVDNTGRNITDGKMESIRSWAVPKDKRELEGYLGFMNYHREFIPNFAGVSACLYEKTGKAEFGWGPEQQLAFEELKRGAMHSTTLIYPNSEEMFILDTDASDVAVGAVLLQERLGVEYPVYFASKVLTPVQRRYCTTRRELLAVITFARQFRHYLLGRRFIIRTDHHSLIWLMQFRNPEGQIARWLEELSQYDFNIQHRPGKDHANADGLSRVPDRLEGCLNYRAGIDVVMLPCAGCAYCRRAHSQWSRFESDVDYVVPISLRTITQIAETSSSGVPLVTCNNPVTITQIAETSSSGVPLVTCNNPSNRINNNVVMDETRPIIGYSPEEIRIAQSKDPELVYLNKWLKGDTPSEDVLTLSSSTLRVYWRLREQIEVSDGILYYRWEGDTGSRNRLIVPIDWRNTILKDCHDGITMGHYGRDKTNQKLRDSFYWPGMSVDVDLYVRNCVPCCRSKKPSVKLKAPLGKYHAGSPMESCMLTWWNPL